MRSSSTVLASKPLTIKIRKGYNDGQDVSGGGGWEGRMACPAAHPTSVSAERVCRCCVRCEP